MRVSSDKIVVINRLYSDIVWVICVQIDGNDITIRTFGIVGVSLSKVENLSDSANSPFQLRRYLQAIETCGWIILRSICIISFRGVFCILKRLQESWWLSFRGWYDSSYVYRFHQLPISDHPIILLALSPGKSGAIRDNRPRGSW